MQPRSCLKHRTIQGMGVFQQQSNFKQTYLLYTTCRRSSLALMRLNHTFDAIASHDADLKQVFKARCAQPRRCHHPPELDMQVRPHTRHTCINCISDLADVRLTESRLQTEACAVIDFIACVSRQTAAVTRSTETAWWHNHRVDA